MAPDEEAEDRDREARKRDEAVAENLLARHRGDELADDAHARQDHDVDRRVRVEPEEVLEEHRVAAERRIEDAEVQRAFAPPSAATVMATTGVPRIMTRLVA